jgi:membrane protease YdiL (CAAX protease family)
MQYKSIKGFTGMGQLGILFVFIGGGLVLAAVLQYFIAITIVPEGTPMSSMADEMMKALNKPANVNTARLLQVLGTFCMLFIPSVMFSWVCNGKNPFWLGFNKYLNIYQVLIGFLIIFTANIMAAPMEELVKKILVHIPSLDQMAKNLESAYNDQVVMLSNLRSLPELILAILIMAFFPAMFEEMFFRGALQNLLIKWWKMPVLAIIVTSLLFSLIHLSVYLFLSRALLGFVLGMMYLQNQKYLGKHHCAFSQ